MCHWLCQNPNGSKWLQNALQTLWCDVWTQFPQPLSSLPLSYHQLHVAPQFPPAMVLCTDSLFSSAWLPHFGISFFSICLSPTSQLAHCIWPSSFSVLKAQPRCHLLQMAFRPLHLRVPCTFPDLLWRLEFIITPSFCCCCSVTKSCLTLCDPVDYSMPGSLELHFILEFARIHAHWVGDATQLYNT